MNLSNSNSEQKKNNINYENCTNSLLNSQTTINLNLPQITYEEVIFLLLNYLIISFL